MRDAKSVQTEISATGTTQQWLKGMNRGVKLVMSGWVVLLEDSWLV